MKDGEDEEDDEDEDEEQTGVETTTNNAIKSLPHMYGPKEMSFMSLAGFPRKNVPLSHNTFLINGEDNFAVIAIIKQYDLPLLNT